MTSLMASSQCVGESSQTAVSMEMCMPSLEEIISKVDAAITRYSVDKLFIATDQSTHEESIRAHFRQRGQDISIAFIDPEIPQIDLILLGEARVFIGNCVSSFSSFVRRHRDSRPQWESMPTWYFGMPLA